ncbi:malonate decarboxylase holo-[acyl-carrier-protein] synthase [Legionella maioricensis]|uniref:Malonate decarboxylase holo-[acyl-carrier-protein] synthase n=1 Tax=Legionella maioricensis TaxID=2896528 RepID=A0A9X2IB10_9GAMM|nr:malonate decarboxylase holo-[acyl-carrier-protein] synthase [Legionella maioricensis]MCL9684499.1 malonate decarboxylase holo-[acyl-carrier-protein] synthase [Legionella maioricensis]MCL9687907.1 malonate decarboxylase holo-[acyl-carrier-protein] synthase [Legionella maioricensis]
MMSQRHQLVFLEHDSAFVIHSIHEEKQAITHYVNQWINQGLPCIYARQLSAEQDMLDLGLPVFLANKKHRVGLRLNKNKVSRKEDLPRLIDMASYFCKKIKGQPFTLFSQQDMADFHSISVYGSFLWEYLSEQPFVGDNSDLDLLIDYEGHSLDKLKQILTILKKKFNRTIDGEVRFKKLGDIAVNELVNSSADQLLFKNTDEIGLISRHDLYKQYPDLLRL